MAFPLRGIISGLEVWLLLRSAVLERDLATGGVAICLSVCLSHADMTQN